jgi:hypothetical protein
MMFISAHFKTQCLCLGEGYKYQNPWKKISETSRNDRGPVGQNRTLQGQERFAISAKYNMQGVYGLCFFAVLEIGFMHSITELYNPSQALPFGFGILSYCNYTLSHR